MSDIDIDDLTPAQYIAYTDGYTNNVPVGRSLVGKGVFVENTPEDRERFGVPRYIRKGEERRPICEVCEDDGSDCKFCRPIVCDVTKAPDAVQPGPEHSEPETVASIMNAPVPAAYFKISFDRIGRHQGSFAVVVGAHLSVWEMAQQVRTFARNHLVTRDFTADVDLESMTAAIGAGRYGVGKVTRCTADGGTLRTSKPVRIASPRHGYVAVGDEWNVDPSVHLWTGDSNMRPETLCGHSVLNGMVRRTNSPIEIDCQGCLDVYTR